MELMRGVLNSFLRHAAYASAALALVLVGSEVLLPGSVMPYVFLPWLIVIAGVLQFLAPPDEEGSIIQKGMLVILAVAAISVVLMFVETAGRAGVVLKIGIIALIVVFVVGRLWPNSDNS